MAKYVGAIDQGTTSTRFMIFDHAGREVARHQMAHEQITPAAGRVEHDPHEIWETTQDVVGAAMGRAGITADDLVAIGITNQRETIVVWDRRTGEPYCPAIVRGDIRADALGASSAGSIRWILENVDDVRTDAEAGHAIAGTIDTWLIWWLTGGPDGGRHLTDVTNAGRTTLMDIETLSWDDELIAALDIPASMLAEIRSSSQVYATTVADGPFGGEVQIAGDLADRSASLVGQACLAPGELADVGDALVLGTGTRIVRPTSGPLPTLAYRFGEAPPAYALEDSTSGAVEDRAAVLIAAAGARPSVMRIDGAANLDEPRLQAVADALGIPVSRPVVVETAALGAACAAGLAVGFWASTDELVAGWNESRRWEPAAARA
jgi:glycerol kinase